MKFTTLNKIPGVVATTVAYNEPLALHFCKT